MTATPKLSHRLMYYTGIGASSAGVHIMSVLYLVARLDLKPLMANVIAFFIAFNFSFFGHKYLTFSKLQDQKQLSLPHFFLVAASAGVLNELLYFLLLQFTVLNYMIALVLVLGLVSVYSYILSRFWACR
ncbi:GtrA family protein [Legionella worsleiensis]|uniref:GtrA-like protein n=1 Tax=Legionella worsleiensis TaxID=45076 RepID=A0A0W1AAU5_9GAMM|nr:GtrA family protein [Legionella worsleiensis]KTD78272.1 GtrA-like protein [Legionella worsleiensis]STY32609.1 putative GtrA-like protein [Legionella worsleiensis]